MRGDLCTVAQLQAMFPDNTKDGAGAALLITRVSAMIKNAIQRDEILPTDRSDSFDGNGQATMVLPAAPVLNLTLLVSDGIEIAKAPLPGVGVTNRLGWFVDANLGILKLAGHRFCRGVQNILVNYRTGYQISAEAQNVPSTGDYSITVAAPKGPWATDEGVTYISGGSLTPVAANPTVGQYTVDATGKYTFNAADAGRAVSFNYGYVPADLNYACAKWVAESMAYRGRIGQASVSLAGQETVSYIVRDCPPEIMPILQNFKRVVPL